MFSRAARTASVGFLDGCHRLYDHRVGAPGLQPLHLLHEGIVHFDFRDGAQGFQELARGAYGADDEAPFRGLAAGVLGCETAELRDPFAIAVLLLHEDAAAERVGQHHIGAGVIVLAGHFLHNFRMAGVELLRATARLEAVLLQEGAGGAVGYQEGATVQPLQQQGRTTLRIFRFRRQFTKSSANIIYVAFYASLSLGRNMVGLQAM